MAAPKRKDMAKRAFGREDAKNGSLANVETLPANSSDKSVLEESLPTLQMITAHIHQHAESLTKSQNEILRNLYILYKYRSFYFDNQPSKDYREAFHAYVKNSLNLKSVHSYEYTRAVQFIHDRNLEHLLDKNIKGLAVKLSTIMRFQNNREIKKWLGKIDNVSITDIREERAQSTDGRKFIDVGWGGKEPVSYRMGKDRIILKAPEKEVLSKFERLIKLLDGNNIDKVLEYAENK